MTSRRHGTPPATSSTPTPPRAGSMTPRDSPAANPPRQSEDRGVLDLVNEIKKGETTGKALAPGDRQRCVEYFLSEGMGVVEIAGILGVSERTVQRDKGAVRSANALRPRPELIPEIVGWLLQTAEQTIVQLSRFVRDREAPAAVRFEAARDRFSVCNSVVQRLQSLGYLPEAARQIRADHTHRSEEPPELDTLSQEFEMVYACASRSQNPEFRRRAQEVRGMLDRARLGEAIASLAAPPEESARQRPAPPESPPDPTTAAPDSASNPTPPPSVAPPSDPTASPTPPPISATTTPSPTPELTP